jgi:GT2 family glycosyltransferase
MAQSPLLSISIVNWNTATDLVRALESLPGGGIEDYEIIVVDNASTDGSAELIRAHFPQVQLIQNSENVGFACAHNQALRISQGKFHLLLNPDATVHSDALRLLLEFLQSEPRAGAVGPKLLNADGTIQYSCRHFPSFGAGLFRNTFLGRLFPNNRYSRGYLMADWDHASPREVDWLSGAALCIRRETLDTVGLLDENFFMYCEDVDWCYRAQQAGWKIFYLPIAAITHLIGRSSDQRPLAMVRQFHRSMAYFFRKHYARNWPVLLRWVPFLAIRLRLLATISHYHLRNGKNRCPKDK